MRRSRAKWLGWNLLEKGAAALASSGSLTIRSPDHYVFSLKTSARQRHHTMRVERPWRLKVKVGGVLPEALKVKSIKARKTLKRKPHGCKIF